MMNPQINPISVRQFSRITKHSRLTLLAIVAIGAIAFGVNLFRSHAQIFVFSRVTVVSAATFEETPMAPESIAVAFGQNLSLSTASATSTPLPVTLAGTIVRITDSAGAVHTAPLFFVSPQQVNFLIPAGVAHGAATVTVIRSSAEAGYGTVQIAPVAPGLFSANSNGQGAALGFLMSVPQSGQPSFEPLAEFDQARRQFVTRPLQLFRQTPQAERLFFVLFGTGIRGRANLDAVTARAGGVDLPVSFAGAQGSFVGFDQINIPIDVPRMAELVGRGRVNVALSVAGGGTSNVVEVEIAGTGFLLGPKITGFEPARALAGDTVTIKGEGFDFAGNFVRIGALEAPVVEAAPTQLKIKVPYGAETGKVTVRRGLGLAISDAPLIIRTTISGIVEDTRRRPIPGVTVRLAAAPFGNALLEARTNAEGVFVLPDVPPDETNYMLQIDGTTAGASPHFPRHFVSVTVQPNRDNAITRPIALQLATGAAIKVNVQNLPVPILVNFPASATSYGEDWIRALEPVETTPENDVGAQAALQSCLTEPGSITLDLPPDLQVILPCGTPEECANRALYVTQVENSRAPVKLPLGHFGSTMVQISPFEAAFLRGTLTIPNSDCLPSNTKARIFLLNYRGFVSVVGGILGPGRFVEIGEATVSPDGQRITTDGGAIIAGGIYFVSAARPAATIIGRVVEPSGVFDPVTAGALKPLRRVNVAARGQEALTDGNGFFVLRNVPVLGANDRVAVEITYLRPTGRVERALLTNIAIGAGATSPIGDVILSASNTNRPPVIIAAPSFTAEEGKRTDLHFVATDPDAGQTMQLSVAGPPFASLINRGSGSYSLRVAPGFEDAGAYTLTITASDNQNSIVTQSVALTVFNTNQPPVANSQSVAMDEDVPQKITLTGSDPDRNALRYTIINRPAHGRLTGDAPDLTFVPDKDYFGSDSFTFKVNDGAAESAPATVTVAIKSVNDTPLLNVPIEQKVTAGNALNFAVSAMDVDVIDSLTFAAADLPQGATFNQIAVNLGFAAQFSWTPTQQQTGLYIVTFRATDNGAPPSTAARTVAISVLAQNAGPRAGMWAPTSGPVGGEATALLVSGSNVLAGTFDNGIYRSTDSGDTWKNASAGLPFSIGINALALLGDTIIAASSSGIYRSTDNGENWAAANEGLGTLGLGAVSLAVKGGMVFAGTYNSVYASSDRALTWKPANKGLPSFEAVRSFAVAGSALFASVGNFGIGSNLYRTDDNGENWARVNINTPQSLRIETLAASGATLFAGTLFDRVYRSTDGGQNWTPINTSQERLSVFSLLVAGDALFAGSVTGVYILPVNGQVSRLPDPVLEQSINALAARGSGAAATIYAGTSRDGVFRSINNGQNWAAANNGYTNLRINAFASTTAETFTATERGVFVTANQQQGQQATTWRPLNKGLPESGGIQGLAIIGSNLFAGMTFGGVFRLDLQASDQSRMWESANAGLPGAVVVRSIAASGNTLFAGVFGLRFPAPAGFSTYRSTDLGRSWTPAANGLPNTPPAAFATLGATVFAATDDGVYISSDKGENWAAANNGLPPKTMALSLATAGANIFLGTAGRGVFISTNQGQSWTQVNTNLPPNVVVPSLFANGPNLFAVILPLANPDSPCPFGGVLIGGRCFGGVIPRTFGGFLGAIPGNVFISTNNGQNWAPIMSGLDDGSATALGAAGSNVFAATLGQGVFARQF